MELVTAVITTCKREPATVERAVKSVINQTYPHMQIILVDDSPSNYEYRDEIRKMAQKYKEEGLLYIQHSECSGACAARNTGLSAAKGKYIAYLDDDDEWKSTKIEIQVKGFNKDEIALVYCGSITHNDDTNEDKERPILYKSGYVYPDLILGNFVGSTSFPLIRTEYLRAVGGFDILMQSAQDFDVWLRLASKYEFNYVKEDLVIYHVHSSEQISKSFVRRIKGLERINEKNASFLEHHKKAKWKRLMIMVPEYKGNDEVKKAYKTWLRAVVLWPTNIKENILYLYSIFR